MVESIVWWSFKKNKLAIFGLIVISIIIFLAVFAPFIAPYAPDEIVNLEDPSSVKLLSPCREYPFGTDNLGRDEFSRILYGARISIEVGFFSMLFSSIIGITLGGLSGFFKKIDWIVMRLIEILSSLPYIVIIVVLAAIIGPSFKTLIFVMGITSWPKIARIVRGQFLSLRERTFVMAAKSIGESDFRVIFSELIPNTMSLIIINITLMIAGFILSEAGLSFLGLGVQPPTPSWGNMLKIGIDNITHLHLILFPTLSIFMTVLSINFIGDGLRDALDPRLRE